MKPDTPLNGKTEPQKDDPVNLGGREGGDDSLKEASPNDSRADEKVIVNEQREDKIVNAPPQTGVNSSESSAQDEEILGKDNL